MAMACPVKKQLMKEKIQQQKDKQQEKQEETYAKIAKKTIQTVQQESVNNIQDSTCMQAILMVMDAHIHNTPRQLQHKTKSDINSNNVKPVKFPDVEDSNKLFNEDMITKTMISIKQREKIKQPQKIQQEITPTPVNSPTRTRHNTENDTDHETETQTEEILDRHLKRIKVQTASFYGAKIVADKSQVAYQNLDGDTFCELYGNGKIKCLTSEVTSINADQFEYLVKNRAVVEHRDKIKYLDPTEFKKARNITRTPEKDSNKKARTSIN